MRVLTVAGRSRRIAVLALCAGALGAGVASAATTSSPTLFSGRTSQGKPVTLKLEQVKSAQGTEVRISRFTIEWFARCRGIRRPLGPLTTYHVNYPVAKDAWAAAGRYSAPSGNGYIEKFSVRDHGTIDGALVTGVFKATVRVLKASNSKFVTSCQSGTIRFLLGART